jgi:general secretion pathway protein H
MKDDLTPSPEKYHPSGSAGFTLIELIVVRKAASDARKIASLLRYLNDTATYTKETYSLKFDLRDAALSWEGPDGGKHENIGSLSSVYLPSKGEINEGEVTILFGPLGAEENIEVHLRDKGKGMTVTFSPISGRAKISEG